MLEFTRISRGNWLEDIISLNYHVCFIQMSVGRIFYFHVTIPNTSKFATNRYHNTSSVSNMLSSLQWPTIQQRRLNIRMCMIYKIIHNLVAIPQDNYFIPKCRLTPNQHPYTFMQYQPSRDYFKFSFFPRSIPQLNSLPTTIVMAPSLVSFQNRLVAHQATPI